MMIARRRAQSGACEARDEGSNVSWSDERCRLRYGGTAGG
jgi:hypothetical protein